MAPHRPPGLARRVHGGGRVRSRNAAQRHVSAITIPAVAIARRSKPASVMGKRPSVVEVNLGARCTQPIEGGSEWKRGRTSGTNGRAREEDRWALPVLDASPGGPAERFAGRLRGRHPAAVFFAALLAGFDVLALISIALGLLVTDVLLDIGGVARHRQERRSSRSSPSAHRSSPTPRRSARRSAALRCCRSWWERSRSSARSCRKWLIAAFAVFVLVVESATYRVTSLAVPRERPARPAARGSSGRRQLPVRSHGGGDRRLRRPRAAPHVAVPDPRASHLRVGGRDR